MKTYKHYLIMDVNPDNGADVWELARFPEYNQAVNFCNVCTPKDCQILQIWGTDEDPDTFTGAETLYIKDMKTGAAANLIELNNSCPQLAKIAWRLWEGGESIEQIMVNLSTVGGCLEKIDYLLTVIEELQTAGKA